MRGDEWTDDEFLVCLAFYSTVQYPKVFSEELIKECAALMPNRSTSSIGLRLANFVARDPIMIHLGHKGMSGGGRNVDIAWSKFSNHVGELDRDKLILKLLER